MAHPVIESHIGASQYGGGDGAPSDVTSASGPGMLFDRTPHCVAGFALAAFAGIVLLRLSGFRFAVGGSIGG